jgi:hypothetical protein
LYATLGLASSVALSREAAVEDDKSEPSTYILASNNLIARGYYSQVANNNSDIGAFTHPLFLATFHFLDLSKKKKIINPLFVPHQYLYLIPHSRVTQE